LGFHYSFHVSGPSELGSDENTRRLVNSSSNDDFLDLVSENVLHELTERFEAGLFFFSLLLFFLGSVEFESFLGNGDELLAVVFLYLLDHVLIDGVSKVENFESTLLHTFHEGGGRDGSGGFTGDVVDGFLFFLHAGDVFFEGDKVLSRL